MELKKKNVMRCQMKKEMRGGVGSARLVSESRTQEQAAKHDGKGSHSSSCCKAEE